MVEGNGNEMNFMEHVKSDRMCCFTYTEVHACFLRVREHVPRLSNRSLDAVRDSSQESSFYSKYYYILHIYTYINIYTYTYADFFPEHTRAIFLQLAKIERAIGRRKRGGKKKKHFGGEEPAAVGASSRPPPRAIYVSAVTRRATVFIEDCQ